MQDHQNTSEMCKCTHVKPVIIRRCKGIIIILSENRSVALATLQNACIIVSVNLVTRMKRDDPGNEYVSIYITGAKLNIPIFLEKLLMLSFVFSENHL